MEWRGTTTLITGASSGIGAEFAHRIAAAGGDLVLVARREDRLRQAAAELEHRYGVTVTVLPADLAAGGAAEVVDAVDRQGVPIDGLINNAGFATHGDLHEEDPQRIADEIAVNVAAVVSLTQALLPGMRDRGRGVVVNLASTAAFQPVPHMAVYAATKAFVLSFTEALWAETRGTGVRVLALAPGATETEFFSIAGESASVGRRQSAAAVVDAALRALDRPHRPTAVSGTANRILAVAARLMPRRLAIGVAGRSVASPTPSRDRVG